MIPTTQDVFGWTLRDAALDTKPAEAEIIYVARQDTGRRRVTNEVEAISMMVAEGVKVIAQGDHSVREQINLFAKADGIIGPHGAGLTNVAFCRPGTICYELIPSAYVNPCFARLAQAGGLEYWADRYETSSPEDNAFSNAAGAFDLGLLQSRLRDMKARLAKSAHKAKPRVYFTGLFSAWPDSP